METERTVWNLARLAGCSDPDTTESPGAQFLRQIESAVSDLPTSDVSTWVYETADTLVPVYTVDVWRAFVDLGAWGVDTSEYGSCRDVTETAKTALYVIAQTLLAALVGQSTR